MNGYAATFSEVKMIASHLPRFCTRWFTLGWRLTLTEFACIPL
jgi:hypothetical protein